MKTVLENRFFIFENSFRKHISYFENSFRKQILKKKILKTVLENRFIIIIFLKIPGFPYIYIYFGRGKAF